MKYYFLCLPLLFFSYIQAHDKSDSTWQGFCISHIHYPDSALHHNIQGRVDIQVIENKGIRDIIIAKSIAPDLDSEALRLVREFYLLWPKEPSLLPVQITLRICFQVSGPVAGSKDGFRYKPWKTKIYNEADEMPRYPGGGEAQKAFINKNLSTIYNDIDTSGTVIVSYVVDTDGSVTDVEARQPFRTAYDKEAVRLVQSFPDFTPGKVHGQVVPVQCFIAITFKR